MSNNIDLVGIFETTSLIGIIFAISCFVRIPKLEINIWSLIGRKLGNVMNHDMFEKIDEIETQLDSHIKQDEADKITLARKRILRFNDEILHKIKHTREHFLEILLDVDEYEKYCNLHPEYPNNRAELAMENIKKVFQECEKENNFL